MEGGPRITTFLMFTGQAEEAMNLYVSLFEGSRIVSVTRYGLNEPGPEGSVYHAIFSLHGQEFMCIDSPVKHDFTFTPAISLYVSCEDETKIARYFEALAEGGQVLMPLDAYPFSRKFGWVQDRFGVSWQLSAV
jgi:predicted 3-demethylubiquinone-9 3-methyltransferase (glyoxalase superfamily)